MVNLWKLVKEKLKEDLLFCETERRIIKVGEWKNTLDYLTFGIIRIIEETLRNDLSEILNSLNNDLELDFNNGEEGYNSYKESHNAINEFTLKLLKKKYQKYGGKK